MTINQRQRARRISDRDLILDALKVFVLRSAKREATAEEIAVLPAVAKILLDYLPSDESNENYVSSSDGKDSRIEPQDKISCLFCNRDISSKWNYCPKCGNPIYHQISEERCTPAL